MASLGDFGHLCPGYETLEMKQRKKAGADERSVGMLLKRAEQAMLRSKTAALKPVGLTLAQYVALAELEQKQGITAATLARACFVSPQAIMILLKSMEQQGLITRRPHPRHPNVLEVHMTEVGREALHAGRAQVAPVEESIFAAFSKQELEAFRGFLSRFVSAIDAG
jgi:DNA-binding MarR family transcriptional regulator